MVHKRLVSMGEFSARLGLGREASVERGEAAFEAT